MNMKIEKISVRKIFTDSAFLFLTGAVIGWLYEVLLHLVTDGAFVNRGMLHGPWLPIYGVGCLLMVGLKIAIGGRPVLYFAASTVACGAVEYAASWLMETFYNMRWWDYSDCPLNLNGRIFAGGLLGFGIAGCLFVYGLLPILAKKYNSISVRTKEVIAFVFVLTFLADAVISAAAPNMGLGITNIR